MFKAPLDTQTIFPLTCFRISFMGKRVYNKSIIDECTLTTVEGSLKAVPGDQIQFFSTSA